MCSVPRVTEFYTTSSTVLITKRPSFPIVTEDKRKNIYMPGGVATCGGFLHNITYI